MLFRFDNKGHAPLIVRFVEPGDAYGRGNVLVNSGSSPLVEFYDARYADEDFINAAPGQFISRYYLSTLISHVTNGGVFHGLDLDGGIRDWTANGETMRALSAIMAHLLVY